jgi:CubicO group peptidase (beta-lactamase class C family)
MQRLLALRLGRAIFAVLIPALVLAGLTHPSAMSQDAKPLASTNLTGVAPLLLTGERRAQFEAYVADALLRYGVPGASVAVVQDGELVYLNGFGVTEVGSTRPVTPDTLMMVGSITKTMTTMLAASLVDDGVISWDTRLVDLLPGFAAGDAAMTTRLTVRDAFCNCSGLPGPNLELYFAGDALTPAGVLTLLDGVPPTTPFGEQFVYSNPLVASGGYALGVAAGGGADDVGLAYDTALRERVLGPIGMTRSTFQSESVLADGDYALPHAVDLSGELRPLSVAAERWVMPLRPAGGLWSSAREMARYLQTELAHGVAPGGTRVASEENLERTWEPVVEVPNFYGGPPAMAASMAHYGLGWESGDYRGLRVLNHAGGTSGFTSEIAFLPEAGLGIVILANSLSITPIPLAFQYAVQFRLFELLFDQPAEFDAALAQSTSTQPTVALGDVDPGAVAPFLGRYVNPELCEVAVALRDDRLMLETAGGSTELRPPANDGGGAITFLMYDPPLSLYSQAYGVTVSFAGGSDGSRLTVTVPANPTGAEQIYAFEPLPDDATPAASPMAKSEEESPYLVIPDAKQALVLPVSLGRDGIHGADGPVDGLPGVDGGAVGVPGDVSGRRGLARGTGGGAGGAAFLRFLSGGVGVE